jgi:hypothetical protein
LLLFSAGLAALAADNYQLLAAILLRPQNKYANRGKEPLFLSIYPGLVIKQDLGSLLPGMDRHWTPTSDYLVNVIASPLKEYIPDQKDFEDKFDRLEYLISLNFLDHSLQTSNHHWGPIGRFGWRFRDYGDQHIAKQIQDELNTEGENWKPLKSGFFGGSIDRANIAQNSLVERLKQVHWY